MAARRALLSGYRARERLILSAAGEGIYGVNAEGITTFVNPPPSACWVTRRPNSWATTCTTPCTTPTPMAATTTAMIARSTQHSAMARCGRWIRKCLAEGRHALLRRIHLHPHPRSRQAAGCRDCLPRHHASAGERGEKLRTALAEVDRLRERLERENEYLQEGNPHRNRLSRPHRQERSDRENREPDRTCGANRCHRAHHRANPAPARASSRMPSTRPRSARAARSSG